MESSLRLRLVFQDRKILTDSQSNDGLKRSWVLLNQTHETISDLSDYLLHSFDLRQSCPDGLVLSVDGFVLPSFESTSILKENDVIRVKKKRGPIDIAGIADGRKCLEVGGLAIVAEQPVNGETKLLAIEGFEKESGGYRSESEDGEPEKELEDIEVTPEKKPVSKKRKALKKLNRSNDKKKRRKSDTTEEGSGIPVDVQNKIHPEQNGRSHQEVLEKSPAENGKLSDTNKEPYSSNSDSGESERDVPSKRRSNRVQEDGKGNRVSSPGPDGSVKRPSRSTRRKQLKRKWLREQKLKEKELSITDYQQSCRKNNSESLKDNQQSSGYKSLKEHQQPEECDDDGGDIVPIVVRPGHIRFEPFGKVDAGQIQEPEHHVETFQWNGVTNKKKGQKWGTEKAGSYKRSDHKNIDQESSYIPVVEEQTAVNVPVEFDKLKPCTTLPQLGDTVAYRVIELSSSWTPELSSFRVGKISKVDADSDRVTLVQVPEYPIALEDNGDQIEGQESAAKSNMSIYGDDGSLEMDYPSLVDVRILKHGNVSVANPVTHIISRATAGNQGSSSSRTSWRNSNKKPIAKKSNTQGASSSWSSWPNPKDPKANKPSSSAQENGKENAWDEICDTLGVKKAELVKEDGWNKTPSTSQSSWSYRALRGSAVGPTMARLRAQNGI